MYDHGQEVKYIGHLITQEKKYIIYLFFYKSVNNKGTSYQKKEV